MLKKKKERGVFAEPTNCQKKQTYKEVLHSDRKQEREKRFDSIEKQRRETAAKRSRRQQFETGQQTINELEQNVHFNTQSKIRFE